MHIGVHIAGAGADAQLRSAFAWRAINWDVIRYSMWLSGPPRGARVLQLRLDYELVSMNTNICQIISRYETRYPGRYIL